MKQPHNLFRPVEYVKPATLTNAVELLQKYGQSGRIIAGGTDLMIERDPRIQVLIDIEHLGLTGIRLENGTITIGAATLLSDIAASPILEKSPYAVLSKAAMEIGTPQIRNIATIGGNLCSAVPSADIAPPLMVLDAELNIVGLHGPRTVKIVEFFMDVRRTVLEADEILTGIRLPQLPESTIAGFCKKGRGTVADLAVINLGVRLSLDNKQFCRDVRISLGAVAPTCIRAVKAEKLLEGSPPRDEILSQVAATAATEIKPISDVRASADYRKSLCRTLVERTLKEVIKQ